MGNVNTVRVLTIIVIIIEDIRTNFTIGFIAGYNINKIFLSFVNCGNKLWLHLPVPCANAIPKKENTTKIAFIVLNVLVNISFQCIHMYIYMHIGIY